MPTAAVHRTTTLIEVEFHDYYERQEQYDITICILALLLKMQLAEVPVRTEDLQQFVYLWKED